MAYLNFSFMWPNFIVFFDQYFYRVLFKFELIIFVVGR